MNVNIKQEPQQNYDSQSSFNMSEMLMYERDSMKSESSQQLLTEQRPEQQELQLIAGEDFASHESSYLPQESQSQQPPPINLQSEEHHDDVGIHDDLAISDSEEDEPQRNSPKENDNENDDIWF